MFNLFLVWKFYFILFVFMLWMLWCIWGRCKLYEFDIVIIYSFKLYLIGLFVLSWVEMLKVDNFFVLNDFFIW